MRMDLIGAARSGFDLKWLVEDFQVALTQELDFTLEAKHAERAQKMFAHRHDVKVPQVLWGTTCKRVLTMEYVAGARVNDTAAIAAMGLSETKVASTLAVCAKRLTFHPPFRALLILSIQTHNVPEASAP
jgi:ubiquinone biosynthesis protein